LSLEETKEAMTNSYAAGEGFGRLVGGSGRKEKEVEALRKEFDTLSYSAEGQLALGRSCRPATHAERVDRPDAPIEAKL
jgi:hypothetical protein